MHDANVEANTIAKLAPGGVDHMARAQLSEKLEVNTIKISCLDVH